jgi:hypothetical protein
VAIDNLILLFLLLSYGIAYPPLGILLLLNICMSTVSLQMIIYYHFQQIALLSEECQQLWYIILNKEIKDFVNILFGSRTLLFVYSGCFGSMILYDMGASYIVLLCLICGTYGMTQVSRYISLDLVKWGLGLGFPKKNIAMVVKEISLVDISIEAKNPIWNKNSLASE